MERHRDNVDLETFRYEVTSLLSSNRESGAVASAVLLMISQEEACPSKRPLVEFDVAKAIVLRILAGVRRRIPARAIRTDGGRESGCDYLGRCPSNVLSGAISRQPRLS